MAKIKSVMSEGMKKESRPTPVKSNDIESKEGEKAGFGPPRNRPSKSPAPESTNSAERQNKNALEQQAPTSGPNSIEQNENTLGKVLGYAYLDPASIRTWEFKNRTIEDLEADPESLREFLEDVEEAGFASSIIVRPAAKAKEGDAVQFEEIVGFKRTYAARKLGIKIPAEIRELTDAEALRLQKSENTERTNPPFWSEARAWAKMDDRFGKTQREKAKAAGVTESKLSTGLRLVKRMPQEVANSLRLNTFGYNALIALIQFIDLDDNPKHTQARIDRLIEGSDKFDKKPEKAETIVATIKAEYLASLTGQTEKAPQAEVVTSNKGSKVYSIKRKRNGITIDLHQIATELGDVEEITSMIRKHLEQKGVQFSEE